MMKFKEFYKGFNEETVEVFKEHPKTEEIQERIVNAWLVHQTVETNKKLVWATWALAIVTAILSGLTLYFQLSK